jgi:hypothetical protein
MRPSIAMHASSGMHAVAIGTPTGMAQQMAPPVQRVASTHSTAQPDGQGVPTAVHAEATSGVVRDDMQHWSPGG